jgi:hypothetical protein
MGVGLQPLPMADSSRERLRRVRSVKTKVRESSQSCRRELTFMVRADHVGMGVVVGSLRVRVFSARQRTNSTVNDILGLLQNRCGASGCSGFTSKVRL